MPGPRTAVTADAVALELDDIQSGALHERPSPYVGTYILLRIDDRLAAASSCVVCWAPSTQAGPRAIRRAGPG